MDAKLRPLRHPPPSPFSVNPDFDTKMTQQHLPNSAKHHQDVSR